MRISVWSSDVGSSDLRGVLHLREGGVLRRRLHLLSGVSHPALAVRGAWALQAREVGVPAVPRRDALSVLPRRGAGLLHPLPPDGVILLRLRGVGAREHTDDLTRADRQRQHLPPPT